MYLESAIPEDNQPFQSYFEYDDSFKVAALLEALIAQLKNKGKVCPKPWCWRRFYMLFGAGYEPPWLSSWWAVSNADKKALFIRQLEFLAYETNRFADACRFLAGLNNDQWVVER